MFEVSILVSFYPRFGATLTQKSIDVVHIKKGTKGRTVKEGMNRVGKKGVGPSLFFTLPLSFHSYTFLWTRFENRLLVEQRIVLTLSVKRNKNFRSAIGRSGTHRRKLRTTFGYLFGWNNIYMENTLNLATPTICSPLFASKCPTENTFLDWLCRCQHASFT